MNKTCSAHERYSAKERACVLQFVTPHLEILDIYIRVFKV